jgi:hypothetical protein
MELKKINYTFLIPTRKRITNLIKTINSIIENTNSINNTEIILGIDTDDYETINFNFSIYKKKKLVIKKVISDRNSGYEDQPIRLKEMIKNSNNDFLIHFADDMLIATKNWDLILNEEIKKLNKDLIYLLYPSHNQPNENWPLCQIISKKWVQTTGKFTNCFETDTELLFISGILNRQIKLDNFRILFFRNKDKTYIEGREKVLKLKYNKKSLLSIYSLYKICNDCEKLSEMINFKFHNKFVRFLRVIGLLIPRILFIKKKYKINYFHIFIKNIKNLKI